MTTNNLNLTNIMENIQQQLKDNADEITQVNSQRFFKETMTTMTLK